MHDLHLCRRFDSRRQSPGPAEFLSSCDVVMACGGVGLSSPFSLFSRKKSEDSHVQRNLTGAPTDLRLSRLSDLFSSGRNISSSAFPLLTDCLYPSCLIFDSRSFSLLVWIKNWMTHISYRSFFKWNIFGIIYQLISCYTPQNLHSGDCLFSSFSVSHRLRMVELGSHWSRVNVLV